MIGQLPESLSVSGVEYGIRTDFRDVLSILEAFNDSELENSERVYVCLFILFRDFDAIPPEHYEEAFKRALWFIDCGADPDQKTPKTKPRTMDWEQDENILFPAVNRVAGREVRALPYLHWWTFYGYFMEIQEGVFSHVLSLRQKKASGKKLEKWERDFWNANKDICELKTKLTAEEQAAKDRLNALLG